MGFQQPCFNKLLNDTEAADLGTTLEETFNSKNPRKDAKNMRHSKDLRVKEGKKREKGERGGKMEKGDAAGITSCEHSPSQFVS